MKTNKGYKFRLKPNREQEQTLRRFVGMARKCWNEAWARMMKDRKEGRYSSSKYPDYRLKKEICEKFDFMNEAYSQSLQLELEALKNAFKKYDKEKREGKRNRQGKKIGDPRRNKEGKLLKGRVGEPTPRRKGERESFSYSQHVQIDEENSRVKLPKIGWVRFIRHREIEGTCKRCAISESCGQWFISFTTEIEAPDPVHPGNDAVGVDVGVAKLCALSNGEVKKPLKEDKTYKASIEKLRKRELRLERALARKREASKAAGEAERAKAEEPEKRRVSANYLRNQGALGKVKRKIARIRADYLHNVTAELTSRFAFIALEDLNVQGMTASAKGTAENPGKSVKAKTGLNREFLNHSPGEFKRQIEYKATWKGGETKGVDPKNTSRACSKCGEVSIENRRREKFRCVSCGHENDADVNAAKNILDRAMENTPQ